MTQDRIRKLRNRSGFTLIEVMIAVFVLAVVLVGLISVTIMIIKGNDFSRHVTTATTLAKDKIEQIKKTSFDNISAGTTTDYWSADSSAGSSGAFFTRTMTVTSGTPAANMKTVIVVVSWSWIGTHNVTLRTIIGG